MVLPELTVATDLAAQLMAVNSHGAMLVFVADRSGNELV